ncbi:MAG: hypothetical protein RJQ03_10750 [Miltoncostaeaceae bacterium]
MSAIALMAIMAVVGMATLAMVNTQMVAAGRERSADRSFNLAESIAHLQVGVFSQGWPDAVPFVCEGTMVTPTSGTVTDDPRCVSPQLVAASLTGVDLTGANWRVQVGAGDSGRLTLRVSASTTGPEGADRAVEALVDRRSAQALPSGYVVIANAFSSELGLILNQVSNVAILQQLLGNHLLIRDGKIGLRCNLIHGPVTADDDPNTCVMGALHLAGPNGLPGIAAILGLSAITNYGYPSAATPAVMDSLRTQAIEAGTHVPNVAHGAECWTGPMTSESIIYVDQVGAGDGTCTVTLEMGTTTEVAANIVNRGRVLVRGQGDGSEPGVIRGVIWSQNGQGATTGDIVRLAGAVQVRGMLVVDGTDGTVSLRPSPNEGTATQIQADSMAEEVDETHSALESLTQEQFDLVAGLIADVESKRALVQQARNASPYPRRNCPILQAAPNHQALKGRLADLADSMGDLIIAVPPLPGTSGYVSSLQSERQNVIDQDNALPHPAPCVLLGLDQILAGLFGTLDAVLVTVTDLLTGPSGLLGYLEDLPIVLQETLDQKSNGLGQLLTNQLGEYESEGMVIYDAEAVGRLKADGGAGMVSDSFRQVAPD